MVTYPGELVIWWKVEKCGWVGGWFGGKDAVAKKRAVMVSGVWPYFLTEALAQAGIPTVLVLSHSVGNMSWIKLYFQARLRVRFKEQVFQIIKTRIVGINYLPAHPRDRIEY